MPVTGTSKAVVASVLEALTPIQQRYQEYMADAPELDRILAVGAERARAIAAPTLQRVKDAMGVG